VVRADGLDAGGVVTHVVCPAQGPGDDVVLLVGPPGGPARALDAPAEALARQGQVVVIPVLPADPGRAAVALRQALPELAILRLSRDTAAPCAQASLVPRRVIAVGSGASVLGLMERDVCHDAVRDFDVLYVDAELSPPAAAQLAACNQSGYYRHRFFASSCPGRAAQALRSWRQLVRAPETLVVVRFPECDPGGAFGLSPAHWLALGAGQQPDGIRVAGVRRAAAPGRMFSPNLLLGAGWREDQDGPDAERDLELALALRPELLWPRGPGRPFGLGLHGELATLPLHSWLVGGGVSLSLPLSRYHHGGGHGGVLEPSVTVLAGDGSVIDLGLLLGLRADHAVLAGSSIPAGLRVDVLLDAKTRALEAVAISLQVDVLGGALLSYLALLL